SVGRGRTCEDGLTRRAPYAFEADPRKRPSRRVVLARDRDDLRIDRDVGPARVGRAGARLGLRAGGGVHYGPIAVAPLQLLVVPVGALGALVLAVPDRHGVLPERLSRVGRV